MAATGARRRWRRGRVQLTATQIRIRRLLSSLAQHCWEQQPGAALLGTAPWRSRHGGQQRTAVDSTAGNCALAQQARRPGADSSGQRRPGRVDPRRRMGSSQDPRGWPRNWTRSATADGQRRRSGRGRRRRARSPANGRRPDLGSGGADLGSGGGRIWVAAAAGSGRRRRPDLGSGGRIWAAAGGIRADEAAGGRAATAAGRRDGGWKKNSKKP
jgi:hypothetical protein